MVKKALKDAKLKSALTACTISEHSVFNKVMKSTTVYRQQCVIVK